MDENKNSVIKAISSALCEYFFYKGNKAFAFA